MYGSVSYVVNLIDLIEPYTCVNFKYLFFGVFIVINYLCLLDTYYAAQSTRYKCVFYLQNQYKHTTNFLCLLEVTTHNTTHNTGPKSIMNQEYNWMFVYNGDTYIYTQAYRILTTH